MFFLLCNNRDHRGAREIVGSLGGCNDDDAGGSLQFLIIIIIGFY